MSGTPEQPRFTRWRPALDHGALTADQIAVLDQMVNDGQSASREAAADLLDWQDSIINKPEHMYGF